jgi:hypothetical protein
MKKVILLLTIVLLIFIIGCTSNTKPESANNQTSPPKTVIPVPEDNSIKAGMYKVGKDLPAGEYVIVSDNGYMEVAKDSTGSLDSIICNDNIQNRSIITVKEGQYLTVNDGKIYPIDKAPKVEAKDNKLPAGMYKVGIDVQPGEYKIIADGQGYVEVAKDSSHSLYSIISNDNFEGEKYITIKVGQYIKFNNAALLLK